MEFYDNFNGKWEEIRKDSFYKPFFEKIEWKKSLLKSSHSTEPDKFLFSYSLLKNDKRYDPLGYGEFNWTSGGWIITVLIFFIILYLKN